MSGDIQSDQGRNKDLRSGFNWLFNDYKPTSQLNFAGDVFLKSTPQLWVVLKVIEMMFNPLTENVQNPVKQKKIFIFLSLCLMLGVWCRDTGGQPTKWLKKNNNKKTDSGQSWTVSGKMPEYFVLLLVFISWLYLTGKNTKIVRAFAFFRK